MSIISTFDIIISELTCPKCGFSGEFESESFFPSGNCFTYRIGDPIINVTRNKMPNNGVFEGYTECPSCKRTFFLLVSVEDNKVGSIEIDKSKKGYIE